MIKYADFEEIKKLIIFLSVVIVITLLTAVGLKELHPRTTTVIKKQKLFKPRLAVKNESQSDEALKIENYELYQLRDPFSPPGLSSQQSSDGNLAVVISEPLPKVIKVYVENNIEKAKLDFSGKTRVLKEHEKFGNYYVIDINSKDKKVVFLYGDEKIVVRQKP